MCSNTRPIHVTIPNSPNCVRQLQNWYSSLKMDMNSKILAEKKEPSNYLKLKNQNAQVKSLRGSRIYQDKPHSFSQKIKMVISQQNLISVFAPNLISMLSKINKNLMKPVQFLLDEIFSLSESVSEIFQQQISSIEKREKLKIGKLEEEWKVRLED